MYLNWQKIGLFRPANNKTWHICGLAQFYITVSGEVLVNSYIFVLPVIFNITPVFHLQRKTVERYTIEFSRIPDGTLEQMSNRKNIFTR